MPPINHIRILRLLFLLCILLCGTAVSAQQKAKFSIASFGYDAFDLTATLPDYEKFDGSGDRYAIIKVTSNNPDDDLTQFSFNFGNMKHIVEPHDGQLWIYVQRNAKHVTITRSGYAPINRYDLHTTIESGKTYTLSITTEGKRVSYQMVQFIVLPKDANATISIKSNKAGSTEELFGTTDKDGLAAKSLEYGSYTYKVLAENHHKQEGWFTLSDKTQTHKETVSLRPNYATITLKSNPGATIYIDGERIAYGSWTGKLKPGSHHIECKQWGHNPSSQYISVTEGLDETITLKSPEPILGTVAITSSPSGAEIKIDGKSYGFTPKSIEVPIGEHKVSLHKDGYDATTQTINVKQEGTATVNIPLSRKITIKIHHTPSWASAYIDEQYQNGNPPYTLNTEIGRTHRIKLRTYDDSYIPIKKNIKIDGKTTNHYFDLKKRYARKSDFYMSVGFGVGYSLNASATLGGHISGFNIEASYEYCLSKSETIWWYDIEDENSPCEHDYKPGLILSGKVGYGFTAGTRFKLTPQIGYRHTILYGDDSTDTYCASGTIGVRTFLAFSSHFGMTLTPEYAFCLKSGDAFKTLSNVSSKIKHLSRGFNANLSFVVFF